ncbi:phage portal protein [Bacillus sp. T33-2]|nr:phage portal protein [Bacillus sp. T33-2]PLR93239.1 phage portal protein [Bacillus sp. T33-2]
MGKGNNTLATNETIFSAVSRLSNAMASLPLKLYKDFSPVNTDESDLLANSPNPNMTAFDFIRNLEVLRDTAGNSYAIKIYGYNFKVESLHIIDPARVSPIFDDKNMELWYEIRGTKQTYYVHNMDILHFKHIHGFGWKGISPIDVLQNTIEFDGEVRKFSLEQMDGAKASFILKYGANVSPEKKKEVVENFRTFYKENGGILFQEPGVDIDQLEQEFINTKVFEVERITRTRVASVYNMPAYMLGETEGASFSSMEQLSLEFVKGTLLPVVRQYEQEFNRKMLTKEERRAGYYYKFNLKALLRADTATQMEAYFKGVRSSIYSPDEVREWEDLPPIGGNAAKLWISGDLYPVDMDPAERKATSTSEGSQQNLKGGGEN